METKSFHAALSTLDATVFPLLQTLAFNINSHPSPGRGSDDDVCEAPPLPVLFRVKTLVFCILHRYLFNDIIHLIRLCPSVEEVTAFLDKCSYKIIDPRIYVLHPPVSLRSLILDMHALLEMTDWMMTCPPYYTTVSSLVIHRFLWDDYIGSNNLRRFMDGLGQNLKKLVLYVPRSARGGM